MKTVAISSFDTPPTASDAAPAPEPGDGEVLVRVHASSVNPVDRAIASGIFADMFAHDFPVVLGRDYAGVVERAGAGVTRYAEGDEVYGFLMPATPMPATPTVHAGSWSELIVVSQDGGITRLPAGLDFATAGAAPLAAITALLSVDALAVPEGGTLLVVGATGGVGSIAVQLAAAAGVTVIAPALPEDEEYLRGLGAAELVDRESDVAAAVRERHPGGVDALLDLASYTPDGFEANAAALAAGARGASPVMVAGEGPGRTNVVASNSTENLDRLAGLLAAGTLRVHVMRSYRLDEAPDALAALSTTHKHGKLGIQVF